MRDASSMLRAKSSRADFLYARHIDLRNVRSAHSPEYQLRAPVQIA